MKLTETQKRLQMYIKKAFRDYRDARRRLNVGIRMCDRRGHAVDVNKDGKVWCPVCTGIIREKEDKEYAPKKHILDDGPTEFISLED